MSEQVSGNPAGVRANRAASSFGVVVGRVHAPHQPPVSPQVLRAGGEFEVVAVSDDAESSTPILYLGHTGDMQVASRDEMRDYVGRGLLDGKRALITGGDSGYRPAVAVAFAKEGADVAIAFFEEDDDAAHDARADRSRRRPCTAVAGRLGSSRALPGGGGAHRRSAGRPGRSGQQRGLSEPERRLHRSSATSSGGVLSR